MAAANRWTHRHRQTERDRERQMKNDTERLTKRQKDWPQTLNDRVQLCVVHSTSRSWEDDVTCRQFPEFPATSTPSAMTHIIVIGQRRACLSSLMSLASFNSQCHHWLNRAIWQHSGYKISATQRHEPLRFFAAQKSMLLCKQKM